jgi:hypothetical protein
MGWTQTHSSSVLLAYLEILMLNFESHAPSKVPWYGQDELGFGSDTLLDSLMDPTEDDMNQFLLKLFCLDNMSLATKLHYL